MPGPHAGDRAGDAPRRRADVVARPGRDAGARAVDRRSRPLPGSRWCGSPTTGPRRGGWVTATSCSSTASSSAPRTPTATWRSTRDDGRGRERHRMGRPRHLARVRGLIAVAISLVEGARHRAVDPVGRDAGPGPAPGGRRGAGLRAQRGPPGRRGPRVGGGDGRRRHDHGPLAGPRGAGDRRRGVLRDRRGRRGRAAGDGRARASSRSRAGPSSPSPA